MHTKNYDVENRTEPRKWENNSRVTIIKIGEPLA